MKSIIGRKMGMSEVFGEDGTMYPVTIIEVLPNTVLQVKTKEHDGYDALQIGIEEQKESRANKCEKGIAKKANTTPKKHILEIKGDEMAGYKVGDEIKLDIFKTGEVVDVIGTSKGHGFSGTVKRWNQKIGPKGHGSGFHRGQGSAADVGTTLNRIAPGKHMAGHYGNEQVTILNLIVVAVDVEHNALLVKGAIPGTKKSLVTIRSAIKVQKGKPQTIKTLVDNSIKEEAPAVEEAPKAEVVDNAPAQEAPKTE